MLIADHVAIEIDGDDDAGAERPADGDRYGVDESAIDQPATVDLDRTEDAGERERGPERVHQAAFVEPHLMAGPKLGGDRHEFALQPLDGELLQMGLEAAV